MSGKKKIILILIAIVVIVAGVLIVYSMPGYYANSTAAAVLEEQHDGVTITETKNKMIVFEPDEIQAGLVFYPGAKIQYQAYAPLLEKLAENDILCILYKMPFNLAILGADSADSAFEAYPEVTDWYICGHSLGGVAAGTYIESNPESFDGLILLASYVTKDISDTGIKALSIYGTKDKILEADEYEANRGNLPDGYKEVLIEGGNHAYFGCYGDQDGDGIARITNEEQIDTTVSEILQLINS